MKGENYILFCACHANIENAQLFFNIPTGRRKKVIILTDAVGTHNRGAAEVALRQAEAKGAKLMDSKNLFGPSRLRLVGTCGCDRCQGKMHKTSVA